MDDKVADVTFINSKQGLRKPTRNRRLITIAVDANDTIKK